jgi:hypothetical protein
MQPWECRTAFNVTVAAEPGGQQRWRDFLCREKVRVEMELIAFACLTAKLGCEQ